MAQLFAERYLDTGITIDTAWTPDRETIAQRVRLIDNAVIALHAEQIPRRLGGDATPAALKADKQLNRRMRNRFETCLRSWGGQAADVTEAYARALNGHEVELTAKIVSGNPSIIAGAQIDWAKWWEDYKPHHQAMARCIATHALKLADRKTANRLVHRLENEWNMLDDLLGVGA